MFSKEVLRYRVTGKPGVFLTGNRILSSAYPRDLLNSVLALPQFAVQGCACVSGL